MLGDEYRGDLLYLFKSGITWRFILEAFVTRDRRIIARNGRGSTGTRLGLSIQVREVARKQSFGAYDAVSEPQEVVRACGGLGKQHAGDGPAVQVPRPGGAMERKMRRPLRSLWSYGRSTCCWKFRRSRLPAACWACVPWSASARACGWRSSCPQWCTCSHRRMHLQGCCPRPMRLRR